jgi:type IV pilus assembly protein PilW
MNHRASPRSLTGFTLIELMVALLLGLIVIGGVISVFVANQQSYRANVALSDVQNESRAAFELMARDIRNAGLTGCDNNGRIANVLTNSPSGGGTAAWWGNWNNSLIGYDHTATDPTAGAGSAPARTASTDSFVVMGGADSAYSVLSDSEPAGNIKLNDTTASLQNGDVIIVCDIDHATIAQLTTYTASGVTLLHNTSTTVTPGNCSQGLGFPTDCTSAAGNSYTFRANAQITKLTAAGWYIGSPAAGIQSLYRTSLVNTNGKVAPVSQEMVRNVTGMSVLYHQAPNTSFTSAATVSNWGAVDAVQVTLTLQSTDQGAGMNVTPISRTFTATTTVRNRVL